MNYFDVKLNQVFIEAKDPTKPKRLQRRVQVVRLNAYSAECKVIEGRGEAHVLLLQFKRLTDPKQWTLEPPKAAP